MAGGPKYRGCLIAMTGRQFGRWCTLARLDKGNPQLVPCDRDVLAEMARLQVLHTRTLKLVHGTERTAVADDRRIASAVVALAKAKQAWVDALHRRR